MADAPSPEHLLHDLAWLKRLATTLAHDRDDADDLAQEALITAWQRQPDTTRPMRGWLTKVVRDLAGMKRRGDRRRVAREHVANEVRASAAPDELMAQLDLQRRLMALVVELDEPYRSTILARFVEGRTSASIAKSLGIPAGTVRKRLHEALSRLRAGLDADAGDRTRWAPAVLAFAQGGIYVAKPTKLVVVGLVALLLGSAATVAVVRSRRSDDAAITTASSETTSSTRAKASAAGATDDARPAAARSSEHRSAERAAMLAAITKAREARERSAVSRTAIAPRGSASGSDSATPTTLDITDRTGDTSEWSKRALGTLNKLLGECYDLGRAEDSNLAGDIKIQFTLVGEPGIGGLLERVEIVDADTTITQQTIRDCFTEQLYALELDPPPDGVTVTRELSLQFP